MTNGYALSLTIIGLMVMGFGAWGLITKKFDARIPAFGKHLLTGYKARPFNLLFIMAGIVMVIVDLYAAFEQGGSLVLAGPVNVISIMILVLASYVARLM